MRILIALITAVSMTSLQAAESFLDAAEVEKLEPHPQVEGVSRHVTAGADPSKYSKMILGNVTFYFADDSKAKDIDADEAKQISDAMKAAMIAAAMDHAEVVLSPGPGAALINIAITEIDMQNKKRGLLGYTPIGLVMTTAGNLTGLRMQLRSAKLEGELVDSQTGDIISVFRIDSIGNWDDKKGVSWNDLASTFEDSLRKGISASRIAK